MLTDKDILGLIARDNILVRDKEIQDPYNAESPVQASSLDLHIGGIYVPGASGDEAGGEEHPLSECTLLTGETVLVRTEEVLRLPKNIGGLAFPPSRFAVKALLVTNAGHVDPEYHGPLRFTLINMGHQAQRLTQGERVGTLILFRTDGDPERGWYSRTGKSGREPNTTDLYYLAKDFLDVTNRAQHIAEEKVHDAEIEVKVLEHRWAKRFGWTSLVVTAALTLLGGLFAYFSPISKLENRLDSLRQEYANIATLESRIDALKSAQAGDGELIRALETKVQQLEKRTKSR